MTPWLRRNLRPLLVVLGGLVLLGSAFAVGMIQLMDRYQSDLAKDSTGLGLKNLQHALRRYHEAHQRFPTLQEGLQALVAAHQVGAEHLVDFWGRPYAYSLHEGGARVESLGADGRPGGVGDDADTGLEVPVPGCTSSPCVPGGVLH